MRAPVPKQLHLRKVGGEIVPPGMLVVLEQALYAWGAVNTKVSVVYSKPTVEKQALPLQHHFIREAGGGRWGQTGHWQSLMISGEPK